jgi:hypothetical protein
MKRIAFFIIAVSFLIQSYGQAPFDYGRNKNIYYISTAEREKLEIFTIYEISQLKEGETGGMNENWDVTTTNFSPEKITEDWSIMNSYDDYKFNFDSIIEYARFINGTIFLFDNKQITEYGGYGYGSFNYSEIEKVNDTLSNIYTHCTGHCGNFETEQFSQNIFNDKKQLIYKLVYPERALNDDSEFDNTISEDTSTAAKIIPDTIYYKYNAQNQLIRYGDKEINPNILYNTFKLNNLDSNYKFHQTFVENIKMEDYIKNKLGYLPKLILLEIYRYGVFSFYLDPKSKKYFGVGELVIQF